MANGHGRVEAHLPLTLMTNVECRMKIMWGIVGRGDKLFPFQIETRRTADAGDQGPSVGLTREPRVQSAWRWGLSGGAEHAPPDSNVE
jgi:hypothetical protein